MSVDRVSATCAVAAIRGGLTMGTSMKLVETELQRIIGEGVHQLVLDLTDCGYSDSAGLGFLVYTFGLISQKGGRLRLCGVSDRIKEMLVTTMTDKILPCDPTPTDSLAKLSEGGSVEKPN